MKTVVVTGVSRGIGKALAKKFLDEGYVVIGTSTSGTADISHENLKIIQLDLANPESIKTCAEKITKLNQPIDILINNAAVGGLSDLDNNRIRIDVLRKILEIDLIGLIDFTFSVVPQINDGGHIINVSSRQGSFGYVSNASIMSYKIAKAGLNMFTRTLSFQLKDKVTVSSVHPGAVMTDMAPKDADMTPEESAQYIYELAISKPETGQFWFKGEKFPW